jgi:hypothetical protein
MIAAPTATLTTGQNNVHVSITLTADCYKGIELGISFGPCTIPTDTFVIHEAQLEVGDKFTPIEYRPITLETLLCQRYYYRVYADNQVFGSAFSVTTNNEARAIIHFPVQMRIAPTALEQTGTASHYGHVFGSTTAPLLTVPVFSICSKYVAQIAWTSNGHTTGQGGNFFGYASSGAYLGWSAEL